MNKRTDESCACEVRAREDGGRVPGIPNHESVVEDVDRRRDLVCTLQDATFIHARDTQSTLTDGKYSTSGVSVDASQPAPQRPPLEMAALIAAVSSVVPSPIAPKSFTLRRTEYELSGLKGEEPRFGMLFSQNGALAALVPPVMA